MIIKLRNSRWTKVIAVYMALQILVPLFLPTQLMAITGGPSQPEATSFTAVGVSDMVDIFSGDFQYNIPLMDVGGYPINISYSSGIGMEQQATCVGLGWNLNAGGVINRSMRGIPDDFDGSDKIVNTTHLKPNTTVGANVTIGDIEVVGKNLPLKANLGFGLFMNNYTGLGFEFSADASLAIGEKNKPGLNLGLGLTANSDQGIGIRPKVGLSYTSEKISKYETRGFEGSLGFGATYNSRAGLRSIGIEASFKASDEKFKKNEDGSKGASKGVRKGAGGLSTSIPIGRNSYIPQINQSMLSTSVSVDVGTGLEAFWINGKLKLGGYFNDQRVIHPIQSKAAYGYMYADLANGNDGAMHDFNREKDASFSDNTPALPMTQMTYDIFTASGQGVSGMYHPYRDFGSVYDPGVSSFSTGLSLGGDLGATQLLKAGINVSANFNYSRSGKWKGGSNKNSQTIKFNGKSGPVYEPVYFKSAGEFSAIDEDYFNKIQGVDPVRIDITDAGDALQTYKRRKAGAASGGETNSAVVDNHRTKRDRKNGPFTILTARDAAIAGLEKQLHFYEINTPVVTNPTVTSIDRTADGRQAHHISEITVNRNDGTRYLYGTQTYNYKQKEVSFNTKTGTVDLCNGWVTYSGSDNSVNNQQGIDHYYSCTELPPYSTAFNLTAVLSADYSDSDGTEGPSPGDLGNYTKFTYAKLYHKGNPYRWRNPYEANKANLSEGYKSKLADNKGNYIYGEKEIQMLHSIETKNYVAEFYYSDRKDAYDVINENGGRGTNTLQKLDRIELYTRCDRETNGSNATALKVVHFEYDYSLCTGIPSNNLAPGTPNEPNQGGKLTLKKVFFTYEKSKKGELSPYIFHYADPDHDLDEDIAYNPVYSFRGNDRWGNYKLNSCVLPNSEDPYVSQDKSATNVSAASWCVSTIQLPSGGIIKVDLESDDYAFVQDKRATRMFKVLGFGPTSGAAGNSELYKKGFIGGAEDNLYMFVSAPDVASAAEFKRKYLGEGDDAINQLFYKFYIDLTGRGEKEYVSGYADVDISNCGWSANRGWIKIKSTSLGDTDLAKIHPIAKTAMQFVRLNLPEYLFGDNPEDMPLPGMNILTKLAGLLKDVQKMVMGTNRVMRNDGFGRMVDLNKSFVRLQTPNNKKLGGGNRVAKVSINDRWATMKGDPSSGDFEYGQTYDYSKIADDPKSSIPVGDTISSGVAVYEPFVGNEENPLRQPVAYSEERRMAPDNDFYQETPYGEMFYPSPSVGYSSVKVTNLKHTGVARSATGYIVHEFYTAKDFPVKVRKPILDRKPKKPSWLRGLFKINIKDHMTTSQSYAIELNDMHGKQKSQRVYAEGQKEAISTVEYFYKTQTSDQLSNSVKVIGKDGIVKTAQAGIEVDMVSDERESESSTYSAYVPGNLDLSLLPPPIAFPLPLPSVWPKVSSEETRFRSIANTKVITRYAILEKTIATDLGSRVSTDNLAWDEETGDVLLTRTQNDFEDPIYSFTYPAHWGYDGMGQSYKNLGSEFSNVAISGSGVATITNAETYFVPGDEVLISSILPSPPISSKYWVTAVAANAVTLLDKNGNASPSTSLARVEIVRSGRRNLQSTPIATVTTLTNPIQTNQLVFKDVLNAGAVEFESEWPGYCECAGLLASTNPYVNGEKGNYRSKRSHLFLTERGQSDENRNTNIRKDGTFANFDPFWTPYLGKEWKINKGQWTYTSEVTLFSPFGYELENKDALGRYSAADYKYNNTLPTTVASNARYKEIGFDNFEDYDCPTCVDDHFSFKQHGDKITESEAHSGRRSIKVEAGSSVQIEKVIVPCQDIPNIPNF